MKLNKVMKLVAVILLLAVVAVFASQVVLAGGDGIKDPFSHDYSHTTDNSGAGKSIANIIGVIINIAQIIGMGMAILMLVVIAILYFTASPEGKAEYKKNATVYIVGAVILFAAAGILEIIKKFATTNIPNPTSSN